MYRKAALIIAILTVLVLAYGVYVFVGRPLFKLTPADQLTTTVKSAEQANSEQASQQQAQTADNSTMTEEDQKQKIKQRLEATHQEVQATNRPYTEDEVDFILNH